MVPLMRDEYAGIHCRSASKSLPVVNLVRTEVIRNLVHSSLALPRLP